VSFDPVSFALGAASAKGGPGGASALSGLTDVDITNPTDGQVLVYNAESGKWENGAGGGAILDSTGTEGGLIVEITAGELYALVQKSMVTIRNAMTEGSVQVVNYFPVMFATTDGNTYSFNLSGNLSAEGLLSTDTVVFTTPK
jgi:hypothetical protein